MKSTLRNMVVVLCGITVITALLVATRSAVMTVMPHSTTTIFLNVLFILYIVDYLVPKRLGRQYLLIRGVAAFMMNMANDIPSG